ncbi:structural maintenance of chromosomes protein 4-like [Schistocerca serialis cubense]|uniref:structural maintenance of chromosomes protein 4-like n=1 Tax=Schistocerca serialis cubense TaxID=2023355 RepID=UPI00214DF8AC|nr:structural maintenance of chromosomes protein 4-like [Schistocerca serialis cubense]
MNYEYGGEKGVQNPSGVMTIVSLAPATENSILLSDYEELYEKYQGQLMKFKDEEIQINSDCIQLDAQLKEALEHVKEDIANLCQEKDSLQYKLTKIQEVVDGKKSQYEVAKSELEVYVLPESTEKEKLKLLIQNLEKMTERLLKTKEEKQQMLERLPVLEKDLMLAKAEKKQLAHEEEICSKQLHVIRMKLHEARQTMRKSVSSNKVVEYLTNCKLENKLPGFFGRLGDLGAIDEMYDVAVSTACGYLNHMVVDTVKTAQESIELLRQSNIGQASFIALEYQQKPENAPRLIDLIKLADERVRVAFYFALRNTLVANDVAQATRVAFSGGNRNRVVTLQGHIIEATGEMTGGGHTVKKGLMSQKVPEAPVTQKTVGDLGKNMQECQIKLEEFTRKIHEIDKKMCFLTPEINNMKTKTQKLETEIMTLEREHPKLEHEVKNQEKRVLEVTGDPAKVAALTLVMGKAKKDYDDAMQKAQEVSSEVNRLSNEIENKINNRVGLIKKNVEENKKKLSSKCYEITKTKADIKRAERFTDEFGIVAHPLVQGVIPKIGLLQQQTEIKVNMITRFGNIMKSNKKIEEINTEIVHLENVINVYKNQNSYLLNLVKDINSELNKVTINHQLLKLTAIEMNKNAMSLCQQW